MAGPRDRPESGGFQGKNLELEISQLNKTNREKNFFRINRKFANIIQVLPYTSFTSPYVKILHSHSIIVKNRILIGMILVNKQ